MAPWIPAAPSVWPKQAFTEPASSIQQHVLCVFASQSIHRGMASSNIGNQVRIMVYSGPVFKGCPVKGKKNGQVRPSWQRCCISGSSGLTQDHPAGHARPGSQALAEGADLYGVTQRSASAVHADQCHILWSQLCNSQRGLDERCLSRPVWRCEPARAARLVVCRPCRLHPVLCMVLLKGLGAVVEFARLSCKVSTTHGGHTISDLGRVCCQSAVIAGEHLLVMQGLRWHHTPCRTARGW